MLGHERIERRAVPRIGLDLGSTAGEQRLPEGEADTAIDAVDEGNGGGGDVGDEQTFLSADQ